MIKIFILTLILNYWVLMRFWVLTGSLENWDTGIAGSLWGTRPSLKSRWDKLSKDDILIFYVKRPVSGIVGIGKVENKFIGDKPFWPDEIRESKVEYPYRFEFKIEYVLPKSSWKENKIPITGLKIGFQAGLNPVSKEATKKLFEITDPKWNTKFLKLITGEKIKVKVEKPKNLHDEIKEKLLEIGRIERFISEKEYAMDGQRLDVVWRSAGVAGAVPKFVFEIEISGGLYRSLAKLKHAYDKWNSNIYLIIQDSDRPRVNKLLSGVFHEVRNRVNVIVIEKIIELHKIQVEDHKLKKEIGLS